MEWGKILRSIIPENFWIFFAKVYKRTLVQCGFYYWRCMNNSEIDPYSIPIIINNYNRLSYLVKLVDCLRERGYNNIYIIDNKSTYPPLLEYYKKTNCKLFLLTENVGYKSLWKTGIIKEFNSNFYVYTDSDVVLDQDCPADFMKYLLALSYKYPKAQKVGLGIHIDDLPDEFSLKKAVIEHEKQFWEREIDTDIYDARIDTTFALYKPYFGSVADRSQFNIRTGGKYMLHHLPWYINSSNPSEEDRFYINAISQSTHWSKQLKD